MFFTDTVFYVGGKFVCHGFDFWEKIHLRNIHTINMKMVCLFHSIIHILIMDFSWVWHKGTRNKIKSITGV